MPVAQALQLAREQNLDLVEVAPTATPPVCRILDYGKFRYEQAKRDRESRKSQKTSELREVRMRPRIEEHDIEFKTRLIRKLLSQGDKVKVTVIFRGREITHPELGRAVLREMAEVLADEVTVEKPPSLEGRNMSMILTQAKAVKAKQPVKES